MYKSPIEMLVADIQHQIAKEQDEEIYKAVVSFGISVDKEELLRALKYDRDQYGKGYADGKADAKGHGRWIEYKSFMECSECHSNWYYADNDCHLFDYCPNCGADMRERKDNGSNI